MTLSTDRKKQYLSLGELEPETFALIKAYRDFKVMLTSGLTNKLTLTQIKQRYEAHDCYLRIFRLPAPLFKTELTADMHYIGSTIYFDDVSFVIYNCDLYKGVKTFKIAFGNETVMKNSLTVTIDYDEKTDFKQVFDLLRNL